MIQRYGVWCDCGQAYLGFIKTCIGRFLSVKWWIHSFLSQKLSTLSLANSLTSNFLTIDRYRPENLWGIRGKLFTMWALRHPLPPQFELQFSNLRQPRCPEEDVCSAVSQSETLFSSISFILLVLVYASFYVNFTSFLFIFVAGGALSNLDFMALRWGGAFYSILLN